MVTIPNRQPTPQRIRTEHAQTLEKYAWESMDETPPVNYISEELFLLLQSVVVSCFLQTLCMSSWFEEIDFFFQDQELVILELSRGAKVVYSF